MNDFANILPTNPVLEGIPGYYVLKDSSSNILAANSRLGEIVGYKDVRDYIGKTDHDIKSSAVECADEFIKQDSYVMKTDSALQYIDYAGCDSGHVRAMLKTKIPYKNQDGKTIGVAASAIDLHQNIQASLIQLLLGVDYENTFQHKTYQLTEKYDDFNLSKRESELLFFLMRGKTMKSIALILDLSPRTIETYLENIKNKMGCSSKSEVIDKAIHSNFSSILLLHMLQKD